MPIFKKNYTDPEDIDVITNTTVLDNLIGRDAVPAKDGLPAKEAYPGVFSSLSDNPLCLDLLKVVTHLITNYHAKIADYKKLTIAV